MSGLLQQSLSSILKGKPAGQGDGLPQSFGIIAFSQERLPKSPNPSNMCGLNYYAADVTQSQAGAFGLIRLEGNHSGLAEDEKGTGSDQR